MIRRPGGIGTAVTQAKACHGCARIFTDRGMKIRVIRDVVLVGHLSHVQVETGLRQQRGQFKSLETISADFGMAI